MKWGVPKGGVGGPQSWNWGSPKVELGGPRGVLPHLELHGVDELPALVALVPAGLGVAAEGAGALHEAVGQVPPAALAAQLLQRVLQQEPPRQQPLEDVLGDPGQEQEATLATGTPPVQVGLTWPAGAHLVCWGVVVRPKWSKEMRNQA